MKGNDSLRNVTSNNKTSLIVVSEQFLETILARQDQIIQLLEGRSSTSINGFITEKKAMELLNKKPTWFWQVRKVGKLPFKKVGKTVYYSLEDIYSLVENNNS